MTDIRGASDWALGAWLQDGPEHGPREGLERALAATRAVPQRPGWSYPAAWLPSGLRSERRGTAYALVVAALLLAVIAAAMWLGSAMPPPTELGVRNGFIVYGDGKAIIRVAPDGSGRVVISEPGVTATNPSVSPDGTRIAYWADYGDPGTRLMVADIDGANAGDLLQGAGLGIAYSQIAPAWSPDGSRLAYTGQRGRNYELLVQAADGGPATVVVSSPFGVFFPAWSRDGSMLAFRRAAGGIELVVVRPDGANPRVVATQSRGIGFDTMMGFAWSPTRDEIVYWDTEIRIVNAVSAEPPPVAGLGRGYMPVWSPDGQRVAFSAFQTIEIVDRDGSNARSFPIASACPITWSPDGQTILLVVTDSLCSPHVGGELVLLDVAAGTWQPLPGGFSDRAPSWQRMPPEE